MRIGEFIGTPCGWDRPAPERLRRKALGDDFGWQSYSTSRCLDGSDPDVLHVIEESEVPGGACAMVELLPATRTVRWRCIGLRFATEADVNDMDFMSILAKAFDFIRMVPPLRGTVAGLCRSIHPLLAPQDDLDVSYSDPSLPCSVFLSCPLPTERHRVERLAESLMHEALHLQLSLVEVVEPLLEPARREEPVFSPWKGEGRTLQGLVHAVYVFGNIRCFWRRTASILPDPSFARARIATIDGEMAAAAHLLEDDSLTAAGRRLATSFLALRARTGDARRRPSAKGAHQGKTDGPMRQV